MSDRSHRSSSRDHHGHGHSSSHDRDRKHKKLRTSRDSIYKMIGGGFALGGNPLALPSDGCTKGGDCEGR